MDRLGQPSQPSGEQADPDGQLQSSSEHRCFLLPGEGFEVQGTPQYINTFAERPTGLAKISVDCDPANDSSISVTITDECGVNTVAFMVYDGDTEELDDWVDMTLESGDDDTSGDWEWTGDLDAEGLGSGTDDYTFVVSAYDKADSPNHGTKSREDVQCVN